MLPRLAAIALLPLVAGCVSGPQDCDPTRTLLFDGLACAMGGGYQQRQAALADERDVAVRRASYAAYEADQASQRQRTDQARLVVLQERVARQDREQAALQRQLAALQQRMGPDPQLGEARANLAEAERLRASQQATPAQLAERDAALARVRAALRALGGI
jgi:hypothetical protein